MRRFPRTTVPIVEDSNVTIRIMKLLAQEGKKKREICHSPRSYRRSSNVHIYSTLQDLFSREERIFSETIDHMDRTYDNVDPHNNHGSLLLAGKEKQPSCLTTLS